MQVKVFESQDMATGLKMVREELGPDALILSTRTVRNSKLGILGKSVLEITAAVDEVRKNGRRQNDNEKLSVRQPPAHKAYQQNSGQQQPEVKVPVGAPVRGSEVSSEIDELKAMVQSLAGQVSLLTPSDPQPSLPVASLQPEVVRTTTTDDPLLKILQQNGVSLETSYTIAGFARETLSFQDLSQPDKLVSFLRETISSLLQISTPDFSQDDNQKRIALVGPTGVGKTTTLAKIAASYLSCYESSIAFITIDTYRIAAVEQLKVYGEIMHLPVEVVITPEQLEEALERHRDKNLILIDTAGRSPRDLVSIEELSGFFREELAIETHLVLSASTRDEELMEAVEHFSRLGINKTIFTKIDECRNLGVILNTQIRNPSPLSYITNGQRVPEDLLLLDQDTVPQLVIPSNEGSIQ